jgi:hypothetical protein
MKRRFQIPVNPILGEIYPNRHFTKKKKKILKNLVKG